MAGMMESKKKCTGGRLVTPQKVIHSEWVIDFSPRKNFLHKLSTVQSHPQRLAYFKSLIVRKVVTHVRDLSWGCNYNLCK